MSRVVSPQEAIEPDEGAAGHRNSSVDEEGHVRAIAKLGRHY